MRKYHDNNKSYNAIVEAMQQIRYNALVEEYGEDEMEEAYMYEAEMSDEEEEAVAQMMDEALYEMDMDDDEDNLNEADDGRKARRRKRLRQALLIGAGLAAAGGAAYGAGRVFAPDTTAAIGKQIGDFSSRQGERLSTATSDIYNTARNVGGQALDITKDAGSTGASVIRDLFKKKN